MPVTKKGEISESQWKSGEGKFPEKGKLQRFVDSSAHTIKCKTRDKFHPKVGQVIPTLQKFLLNNFTHAQGQKYLLGSWYQYILKCYLRYQGKPLPTPLTIQNFPMHMNFMKFEAPYIPSSSPWGQKIWHRIHWWCEHFRNRIWMQVRFFWSSQMTNAFDCHRDICKWTPKFRCLDQGGKCCFSKNGNSHTHFRVGITK